MVGDTNRFNRIEVFLHVVDNIATLIYIDYDAVEYHSLV